ncbi:MAG TPA: glycosyltransferase family 10 [Anaerolineaceae bacterium]|nr:glycosyltransferase family 10 [Anaerolineaceae bacterium]HPN52526.1 glycosyltransferase family 10 [Anaerolineaceae bacterium]
MKLNILITVRPGPQAAKRLKATLQTLSAQTHLPDIFLLCTESGLLPENDLAGRLQVRQLDYMEKTTAEALNSSLKVLEDGLVWILEAGDALVPHAAALVEDLWRKHPEMDLLVMGTPLFMAEEGKMAGTRSLVKNASAQLMRMDARRWGLSMASQTGIGPEAADSFPTANWPSGQVSRLDLLRRTAAAQGGIFLPPAMENGLLGCFFNTSEACYLDLPLVVLGEWRDKPVIRRQTLTWPMGEPVCSPLRGHTLVNGLAETRLKVMLANRVLSGVEGSLRLGFYLRHLEMLIETEQNDSDLQEGMEAAAAALRQQSGDNEQTARKRIEEYAEDVRKKGSQGQPGLHTEGTFGGLADFAGWLDASFIQPKLEKIDLVIHASVFKAQAESHLKAGNQIEAEMALREALLRLPQDGEALAGLARLCRAGGRPEEARGCWMKLARANQMPPDGWLELARAAWQMGDRATLGLAVEQGRKAAPGLADEAVNRPLPAPTRRVVGVWNAYENLNPNNQLMAFASLGLGDDLLKPMNVLAKMGLERGLALLSLDLLPQVEQADAFIFLDRPDENHEWVKQALGSGKPCILFLNETEMILPGNWKRESHTAYQRIFTWNNDWADGQKYLHFYQAQDLPRGLSVTLAQKEKLCTLIASNKMLDDPLELYSHRLAAIRWFEAHHPEDFDLYGYNWDEQTFPSYSGTLKRKTETLARYRFAICYENTFAYPGYITEKLFDCLKAGCVPVYWGAPNVTDVIPADCFVDRRQFASLGELYAFMVGMSDADYSAYLERISAFLAGPASDRFRCEYFAEQVIEVLQTLLTNTARSLSPTRKDLPSAEERFQRIIESPNVSATLVVHQDWLDDDLMMFISALAASARKERRYNLEKNLNQLMDAIRRQMRGRHKPEAGKKRK